MGCAAALVAVISGCSKKDIKPAEHRSAKEVAETKHGKLFGPDFLSFGDKAKDNGIGVNKYLWQATLKTISFLPLKSADPFGGLILTDWYQTPNLPNERMKVSVSILDEDLKVDALKVDVFRQVRDQKTDEWVDSPVKPSTVSKLEDAILASARKIRAG